jgi:hypothetical protein
MADCLARFSNSVRYRRNGRFLKCAMLESVIPSEDRFFASYQQNRRIQSGVKPRALQKRRRIFERGDLSWL